jgi:hypothetical protein
VTRMSVSLVTMTLNPSMFMTLFDNTLRLLFKTTVAYFSGTHMNFSPLPLTCNASYFRMQEERCFVEENENHMHSRAR